MESVSWGTGYSDDSIRKSLTERFAVPTANITVLYGPKSAGYDGPCTREALLAELAKIVADNTRFPRIGLLVDCKRTTKGRMGLGGTASR